MVLTSTPNMFFYMLSANLAIYYIWMLFTISTSSRVVTISEYSNYFMNVLFGEMCKLVLDWRINISTSSLRIGQSSICFCLITYLSDKKKEYRNYSNCFPSSNTLYHQDTEQQIFFFEIYILEERLKLKGQC